MRRMKLAVERYKMEEICRFDVTPENNLLLVIILYTLCCFFNGRVLSLLRVAGFVFSSNILKDQRSYAIPTSGGTILNSNGRSGIKNERDYFNITRAPFMVGKRVFPILTETTTKIGARVVHVLRVATKIFFRVAKHIRTTNVCVCIY